MACGPHPQDRLGQAQTGGWDPGILTRRPRGRGVARTRRENWAAASTSRKFACPLGRRAGSVSRLNLQGVVWRFPRNPHEEPLPSSCMQLQFPACTQGPSRSGLSLSGFAPPPPQLCPRPHPYMQLRPPVFRSFAESPGPLGALIPAPKGVTSRDRAGDRQQAWLPGSQPMSGDTSDASPIPLFVLNLSLWAPGQGLKDITSKCPLSEAQTV